MSMGAVYDGSSGSSCSSSDETESTLTERSGTSEVIEREFLMRMGGVVACGRESQQRVSRVHILQLRFSNRRPSSMVSAHLEKTAEGERIN